MNVRIPTLTACSEESQTSLVTPIGGYRSYLVPTAPSGCRRPKRCTAKWRIPSLTSTEFWDKEPPWAVQREFWNAALIQNIRAAVDASPEPIYLNAFELLPTSPILKRRCRRHATTWHSALIGVS